jgi:hypothetical protein
MLLSECCFEIRSTNIYILSKTVSQKDKEMPQLINFYIAQEVLTHHEVVILPALVTVKAFMNSIEYNCTAARGCMGHADTC